MTIWSGLDHERGHRLPPKQTEALLSIYQDLLGPGTFRDKAALITEELARLAGAEWVTLRLPDPQGKGLRFISKPLDPDEVLRTVGDPVKLGLDR